MTILPPCLLSPLLSKFDQRAPCSCSFRFLSFLRQVETDGNNANALVRMGRPKSFVFDLGEGYPTFALYYDCHGHGVSSKRTDYGAVKNYLKESNERKLNSQWLQ